MPEVKNRSYAQGLASIGFYTGESVTFRLNPTDVNWNFQINTAVTETVGGRVVQVLGANLSDIDVRGVLGAPNMKADAAWQAAESFFQGIARLVAKQSSDATIPDRLMKHPMVFNFPAKGWKFEVYIKSLVDDQGNAAVTHSPGRFTYGFTLTLSVQNDLTNTSRIIGNSNGTLKRAADAAVADWIKREAVDGIGWKPSLYNGPDAILAATAPKPDPSNSGGPSSGRKGGPQLPPQL